VGALLALSLAGGAFLALWRTELSTLALEELSWLSLWLAGAPLALWLAELSWLSMKSFPGQP